MSAPNPGAPDPQLSVVIAVCETEAALDACLSALEAQRDDATEVLAAANIEAPPGLLERHPWLTWLQLSNKTLIPELWAAGITAARGEIVVTTTAHFEPAPDWLRQISAAHRRLGASGIGGAILPPEAGSNADWATYFLRYSGYSERRAEQRVEDLAADNAAYRGSDLRAHRATWLNGFWEPDFHCRVLDAGGSLVFVPEIQVTLRTGFGAGRFCAQRRQHGRQFGRSRAAGWVLGLRLIALASSPLVPLILLAKVTRRSLSQPGHRARFLAALPWLLLFILCWSVGETEGYWRSVCRGAGGDTGSPG